VFFFPILRFNLKASLGLGILVEKSLFPRLCKPKMLNMLNVNIILLPSLLF
jgi:hypothetical protein